MLSSLLEGARRTVAAASIAVLPFAATTVNAQVTVDGTITSLNAIPPGSMWVLPSLVSTKHSDKAFTVDENGLPRYSHEARWGRLRIVNSDRGNIPREFTDPADTFSYLDSGGELMEVRCAHKEHVLSNASTSDGKMVFSGARDGVIKAWEVATARIRFVLNRNNLPGGVTSMLVSPDGRFLIAAHCRSGRQPLSQVAVWDLRSPNRQPVAVRAHAHKTITSMSISADGKALATAGLDNKVVVWKLDLAAAPPTIKKSKERTANEEPDREFYNVACAISPNGKYLAASCPGRRGERTYLRVFDIVNDRELDLAGAEGTPIGSADSISFNPDSLRFVAGMGRNNFVSKITEGNPGTFKMTSRHTGHTSFVKFVSWWRTGTHFASGALDRTVRAWRP